MIYGTSPIQQVNVLANTTQTFTIIAGPKTNNSLLVIVKDSATGNAIEGASVRLQLSSPSYDNTKYTAGSIWSQRDWSGGSGNVDVDGIPAGMRLKFFAGEYQTPGIFTSSVFDTGTSATAYTTLEWQPTSQDPASSIKFQLATNNDNTTWNFIGPDGTASTYYTVPGTTISTTNNNARYIRYKTFLLTTDTSKTPVLTSVNVNYVAGCFTPGQAIFPSLTAADTYSLTISATGYQTQTIDNLHINGYGLQTILMAP
jgi:hypothetical protein